jgi:hypothetical protein
MVKETVTKNTRKYAEILVLAVQETKKSSSDSIEPMPC